MVGVTVFLPHERNCVMKKVPPPLPAEKKEPIRVDIGNSGSGFGISSMVLGILGLLICWIPLLNILGMPLTVLGLILGSIGLLRSVSKKSSGLGFSLAGIFISGFALFISLAVNSAVIAATESVSSYNPPSSILRSYSPPAIFSTPKQKDQPVTLDEYNMIKNKMSYRQVVSIIGHEGEELTQNTIDGIPGVMDSVHTIMYQWPNGDFTSMNATFQNDKLMSKGQLGLKKRINPRSTPRPTPRPIVTPISTPYPMRQTTYNSSVSIRRTLMPVRTPISTAELRMRLGLSNGPSPFKYTPSSKKTFSSTSFVYVTSTGKKYHNRSCRTLSRSRAVTKTTIAIAIRSGRGPCQICR